MHRNRHRTYTATATATDSRPNAEKNKQPAPAPENSIEKKGVTFKRMKSKEDAEKFAKENAGTIVEGTMQKSGKKFYGVKLKTKTKIT